MGGRTLPPPASDKGVNSNCISGLSSASIIRIRDELDFHRHTHTCSIVLLTVRVAAPTSVGRRTEQHLRRLKLTAPRVIQADRSSMVTACVAEGLGFTILTPSLLIDGFVERMPLVVRPLPGPGFSRSIKVVARTGDLGTLPERIATLAAGELAAQIDQQMGQVGRAAITLADPLAI